jgi:hypothetical protein
LKALDVGGYSNNNNTTTCATTTSSSSNNNNIPEINLETGDAENPSEVDSEIKIHDKMDIVESDAGKTTRRQHSAVFKLRVILYAKACDNAARKLEDILM